MKALRNPHILCAALATLLFIESFAVSAAQQATELTALKPLQEYYAGAAKISGQLVASIHINGTDPKSRPLLQAYIPKEWAGKDTCLNMLSDSGLYEAEASFRIVPDWPGGFATLSLKSSQHIDFLRDETNRARFATRLSAGACGVSEHEYTVTYWNQLPTIGTANLELFINSYRADEAYIVLNGHEIDCTRFEDGARISYDFKCEVPLHEGDNSVRYDLEINRVRDGEFDPPEKISVFLPANRT